MAFQETIVVDVRHWANHNPIFRPLHRVMESEISQARTEVNLGNRVQAAGGVIPGERFIVDFKNLKWSVMHNLNLKENKELKAKLRKIMADDQNFPTRTSDGPAGQDAEGNIDPDSDNIATWLWHLWSGVKLKHFDLVSGKIPEEREILKMGRVRTSSGMGLPEKLVEKACFIEKIPEDGKLVGAK